MTTQACFKDRSGRAGPDGTESSILHRMLAQCFAFVCLAFTALLSAQIRHLAVVRQRPHRRQSHERRLFGSSSRSDSLRSPEALPANSTTGNRTRLGIARRFVVPVVAKTRLCRNQRRSGCLRLAFTARQDSQNMLRTRARNEWRFNVLAAPQRTIVISSAP
jgi:hypothetical protein